MNVPVAELGLYPGKSMRPAEDVDRLVFDHNGLFGDRQYMWVEALSRGTMPAGHFLSQREDPEVLTSMRPELIEQGLYIGGQDDGYSLYIPSQRDVAKNRLPVSMWDWQGEAVDQGPIAADWGSALFRRPVQLVAVSNAAPRYVNNDPALGRVGFADGYPLLVASTASVDRVNKQLAEDGRPPIPANRFRANILLDEIEEPFGEDYISQLTLSLDGLKLTLRRAKACARCPIPDTDQITGERHTYVRSALGRLGRRGVKLGSGEPGVFFGQNFIIETPSVMSPGDVIELARGAQLEATVSATTNWQPTT